jgi:prepilin-type N-terminal cleavage/methylation domain-containing protein
MASKIMSIKAAARTVRGWTLVELMMGVTVFSICSVAFASIFLFSIRSYAAMANYSVLDQ